MARLAVFPLGYELQKQCERGRFSRLAELGELTSGQVAVKWPSKGLYFTVKALLLAGLSFTEISTW